MIDENGARQMSRGALAHLGADHVAYIRLAHVENVRCYVLMSALGQELVVTATHEAAQAAAYERGLNVVSIN